MLAILGPVAMLHSLLAELDRIHMMRKTQRGFTFTALKENPYANYSIVADAKDRHARWTAGDCTYAKSAGCKATLMGMAHALAITSQTQRRKAQRGKEANEVKMLSMVRVLV